MQEDDSNTSIATNFENIKFLFTYDIKTIITGEFPNPSNFNISNFYLDTKVAIEI